LRLSNLSDGPFAPTGALTITHADFVRAIVAAPDDNTLRLVYADWLQETGDEPRAEFVRAQVELATPDLDADRAAALRRREKALLGAHGAVWREPFRAEHAPAFTRGFVSSVALSGAEVLEHGGAFFDAAPVTRLSLRGAEEDAELVARVGRCAALGRVRELDVYNAPLGADAARVLFDSPHLAGLRGLHLGEGDATPETVAVLAASPIRLRDLHIWDFHQGDLGDAGLTALAESPAFAALATLDLLQTGVGPEGARAVAESPHLRNLESLSFGFQACGYAPNYIGPEGVRHLARSPHLAGLRHLGLGLTRAGSAGARELATAPHAHGLRSLDFGLSDLRDDGVRALADWPGLARVRWLNLSSNEIGCAAASALARSPHLTELVTLALGGTQVGTEGLRALADSPHLARLRVLWLPGHALDARAVEVLLGDNRFARLTDLHLPGLKQAHQERVRAHFGERAAV